MPNVVITTEALPKSRAHLEMLRHAGYTVRYPTKPVLLSEEDTLEGLQGFAAVIAGSEPYTDRVLAGLPQLRVISRNGVGYDRIDVPAATRRGVAVTITPESNYQAVAEHAMALLLAVTRSVVQNANDTRSGRWAPVAFHSAARPDAGDHRARANRTGAGGVRLGVWAARAGPRKVSQPGFRREARH